jgi:hypothetical protein
MAKWQWHGMAIRSKVALVISAGGNFGRAPDNRRPRGYLGGVRWDVLGDLQRPWRCPTSSDARNATTEATSAGCAILLSACMPGPRSWRSSRAPNRHPVPLPLCHCHIATSIRFPRGVKRIVAGLWLIFFRNIAALPSELMFWHFHLYWH